MLPCALLVDLDGTLANSIPVMRKIYDNFLASFDKPASDAEFARLNGPPLSKIVAILASAHEINCPIADLLRIYEEMLKAAYLHVFPNPGAEHLLRSAHLGGIPVGVVTSNNSSLARTWLRQVGLEDYTSIVIGGDSVRQGKPNPEPYLIALKRIGCIAAQSLAVEDSITGARSALAAGIRTFLLAYSGDGVLPGVIAIDHLDRVTEMLSIVKTSSGGLEIKTERGSKPVNESAASSDH